MEDQDQKRLHKDSFYRQLEPVVEGRPSGEIPLVLGDFDTYVGSLGASYEEVIVPLGRGCHPSNN